jgi:hypothetical protein
MRQQRALQRLNSHVPCRSRRNIRPSRSTRYWGGEDEVFSKGVTALRKFNETRSLDRLMPLTPLFSILKKSMSTWPDGSKRRGYITSEEVGCLFTQL